MRFNGKEAVGIGVIIGKRGDVLALGKNLGQTVAKLQNELPVGLDIEQVANQAAVVKHANSEFAVTFMEALLAVLLVSFLSLGFRTGSIVALTVPLVLAATLLLMWLFGIDLHRISLGTLILALGLLVDDAMIAIEMMIRKLDEGFDKFKAATFAYNATAFPMLTGTLITIVGFLPVGLARSQAGEYTEAIFQIIAITLVLSWFGSVVFTPFLGFYLLKEHRKDKKSQHQLFSTPFYTRLRGWVGHTLNHRNKAIAATCLLLVLGVFSLAHVPNQFFPLSNRPELMVDLWLPEGSSFATTEAAAKRLEKMLAKDADVVNYVDYVGGGSPRFILLIHQQLIRGNLAEFVIKTKDIKARERVIQKLNAVFAEDFPNVRGRPMRLSVGPPTEYPVVFRVFGENAGTVRHIADQVMAVVKANPSVVNVNQDWQERIPSVQLKLDQERIRALGVSTESLSQTLQAYYTGVSIGKLRDGDKLIDMVFRAKDGRDKPEALPNVVVQTANGKFVPLAQLVSIEARNEDGIRWRRNRYPAVTVRADIVDGKVASDVASEILGKLGPLIGQLPQGYHVEAGASKEDAWIAQKSIFVWIPLVMVVTLMLLMIELHNLSQVFLVYATGFWGVIGAGFNLLLFDSEFGFVALLGVIALSGMIMRNSLILVDQIRKNEKSGLDTCNAIVEATVQRFRPIMLTAAAAILAMIPLSFNDFFGPQAIAIMGGLAVATVLTVFFLPALYAAWFKVGRPGQLDGNSPHAALTASTCPPVDKP